jgi:hypothetical protein
MTPIDFGPLKAKAAEIQRDLDRIGRELDETMKLIKEG